MAVKSRPSLIRTAALSVLLPSLLAGGGFAVATGAPIPSLGSPDFAQGPFSEMHMLLKKTILRIKVATIDVRVDGATQKHLAELAGAQGYSDPLGQQLALAVIDAKRAMVQMQFVRDVPLKRWIGVVRDTLEEARKAGIITPGVEQRVGEALPQWFGALSDRGYKTGDRLIYDIATDGVRSVVASTAGELLVDRTDTGPEGRRVVLGSYFASGSEFREPLVRSLFSAAP